MMSLEGLSRGRTCSAFHFGRYTLTAGGVDYGGKEASRRQWPSVLHRCQWPGRGEEMDSEYTWKGEPTGCPPVMYMGRERTAVRGDSYVWVTGGVVLPLTKMSEDVAKASLGGRSGLRLEFVVSVKYLSRAVK